MQKLPPIISIIIPVYNCIRDIEQCLNSIKSQSFEQWEAICVDDGSFDGSAQFLDDFASQDFRFKIIHQNNAGAAAARNTGLEYVSAPYILMIDADDHVDNRYLEKMYIAATENNVDVVICSLDRIQKNGTIISPKFLLASGVQPQIFNSVSPGPVTKLFKTSIIKQHHLKFPEGMVIGEDYLFVSAYWMHAKKLYNIHEALYHYKESESSVTKKFIEGLLPLSVYEQTLALPYTIFKLVENESNISQSRNDWYKTLMISHLREQDWVINDGVKNKSDKQVLRRQERYYYHEIAKNVPFWSRFKIRCEYYIFWNKGRFFRIAGKIKRLLLGIHKSQ